MMAVLLNGCLHIRDNDKFVKLSRTNLRQALGMHPSWLPHYSKKQLVELIHFRGDLGKITYHNVERVHAMFRLPDTTPN